MHPDQVAVAAHPMPTRLRIGQVWIDNLNFDHVVLAETDVEFRNAYQAASLSLADGQPLIWTSRLLGVPLPERIAGSDLVVPLMQRAGQRGWRVYLLGAGPGVALAAAEHFRTNYGVRIAGVDAPTISTSGGPEEEVALQRLRSASPDLVLVALGSPKQEIWIHRVSGAIQPSVAIGVGASFDFIAGRVRRAPRWMAKSGLEWVFRISQQPRLIRRYLFRDPKFLLILLRTMLLPRGERVTNA